MTTRPVVIDLYCGAGGAGMGYWRAGFNVIGVDIDPHPDYPFPFFQGDALEALEEVADTGMYQGYAPVLAHGSPPCQRFSPATNHSNRDKHPDLIGPTRDLMIATGLGYIIENVPQAPLINPVRLCGSSFGLRVRRHRDFESNLPLVGLPCDHKKQGQPVGVYGDHWDSREFFRPDGSKRGGKATSLADGQDAMGGLWWMDWHDLKESIPAQYTEFLGRQALEIAHKTPEVL